MKVKYHLKKENNKMNQIQKKISLKYLQNFNIFIFG